MAYIFRFILPITVVVTSFLLQSLHATESLRYPNKIYRRDPNSTYDSLFTRAIKRRDASLCVIGKSVDSVPDLQKRRSTECPTSESILNVTYSVVFHEDHIHSSEAKPLLTILLDLNIHPFALDSLTGLLFKYRSLVSLRPLEGESGYIYQNLPLRRTDSDEAGKEIALRAPYRNGGKFEISICPLPLCLAEKDGEAKDCTKIQIQIPDCKNENFKESVMPNLPNFASRNDKNCDTSVRISKLRTLQVKPENVMLTFESYNSSYDSVILSKHDWPWISTYLCPVGVYQTFEFFQTANNKTGELSMEKCFLQDQQKEVEDWTLLAVSCVIGAIPVIALFWFVTNKIRQKTKRTTSRRQLPNITYNDDKEIQECLVEPVSNGQPDKPRPGISKKCPSINTPIIEKNDRQNNINCNNPSPGASILDTTQHPAGGLGLGPQGVHNFSDFSDGEIADGTGPDLSNNSYPNVSQPGEHTFDPAASDFGAFNSSAPRNQNNSTERPPSSNTSNINNTTDDPTRAFEPLNNSGPYGIYNLSQSSGNQTNITVLTGTTDSDRNCPDVSVPGEHTHDPAGADFAPINCSAPRNNNNSSMNTSANISSISSATHDSLFRYGRFNTFSPYDMSQSSGNQTSSTVLTGTTDSDRNCPDVSVPGDHTHDPAGADFTPLNCSAPRNNNNFSMNTSANISSISSSTHDPLFTYRRLDTSLPYDMSVSSGSRGTDSTRNDTTRGTLSTNDSIYDPSRRFGRLNNSGPETIHTYAEENSRQSFIRNVPRFVRGLFGSTGQNSQTSSPNSTSNYTDETNASSSSVDNSRQNSSYQFERVNTSGPKTIYNISEENVNEILENGTEVAFYSTRSPLNESIHPLISDYFSYDSTKSREDASGSDSGHATGSVSGTGSQSGSPCPSGSSNDTGPGTSGDESSSA